MFIVSFLSECQINSSLPEHPSSIRGEILVLSSLGTSMVGKSLAHGDHLINLLVQHFMEEKSEAQYN